MPANHSKWQHLLTTFFVALGSDLSAVWILVANGWMQNPIGAKFNYETMRMELSSMTPEIMLIAVIVSLPISLAYTSWAYAVMRGKVTAAALEKNRHTLY